jgi:hypothetical protein
MKRGLLVFGLRQQNPYVKHIALPVLEKKARLFDS